MQLGHNPDMNSKLIPPPPSDPREPTPTHHELLPTKESSLIPNITINSKEKAAIKQHEDDAFDCRLSRHGSVCALVS